MNRIADRIAAPQTFGSRGGTPIDMIVVHVMEGSFNGTLAWFQTPTKDHNGNPQPCPPAAAHWCIAKDGTVCLTVQEQFDAFHAGNKAINLRSIGIELEGFTASLSAPAAQMAALAELIADITARYHIPVDRQHIIGHNEVPNPMISPQHPNQFGGLNAHQDPGPHFNWTDLMSRLAPPSTTTQASC